MMPACDLDGNPLLCALGTKNESEEDVERSRLNMLRLRIRERMRELGLNTRQLSQAAEMGRTYVPDLLKGKNKNPGNHAIHNIAKALKCSTDYLYGRTESVYGSPLPLHISIPIIGFAESGAFRTMAAERPARTIAHAPVNRRYPDARHFALEVRDEAMNAHKEGDRIVPIFEGMTVLCVDMASARIIPESDRIYAIQRSLNGGITIENTIRRAMVYADRIELLPESTSSYDKFVIAQPGTDDVAVTIIGLVYWWFYDAQR